MSLKLIMNRLLKINFAFLFLFSFLLTNQKVFAQIYGGGSFGGSVQGGFTGGAGYGGQGQWGTGMWGGQQGCGYNQRVGSGAIDISDEEKDEREKIAKLNTDLKSRKSEKNRFDKEMGFAEKRLEKIFDSEVLEFILKTHIDNMYQCDKYKDYKGYNCDTNKGATSSQTVDANGKAPNLSVVQTDCGSKIDVTPDVLKANWNTGKNYCAANSLADGGKTSSAICSDETLRPADRKRSLYTPAECNKYLADYRKFKIQSDNAQAKITRAEDDLEARKLAISDARERAKLDREERLNKQTESDYCPECEENGRGYSYDKPKRDWFSIIGQVGLGLGLGFVGKKYDEAQMEYQAQLGYPPQQGYPTAISMGLPYILGGAYGAMYGTQGQGGFGCSGQGGMGMGNGAYGPYGPSGAFGYPQGMFGSPWGGGMYPPGMYPGGGMGGPNGGWPGGMNGGFALNGMMNGGFAMGGGQMGGYPMNGGQMGGYPMSGGYPMNGGIAVSGGLAMNGGYPMSGGYPMNGGQMGGYPMSGGYPMNGGLAVSGGLAMNGGYPMSGGYPMNGGQMGGYPMSGGYPMNGGLAVNGGLAMNGGYPMSGGQMGGYPMNGGYMGNAGIGMQMNNPQYLQMQQQQLQMQMQMQQQQMQMQQQYYQAQMQAQVQAYQRQQAVAQQAQQVQQEIAQLQMRLQMLYSGGSFSGGGYYGVGGSGSIGVGGSYGSAAPTPGVPVNYNNNNGQPYYPSNNQPYNPNNGGSQVTIPAPRGSGR